MFKLCFFRNKINIFVDRIPENWDRSSSEIGLVFEFGSVFYPVEECMVDQGQSLHFSFQLDNRFLKGPVDLLVMRENQLNEELHWKLNSNGCSSIKLELKDASVIPAN